MFRESRLFLMLASWAIVATAVRAEDKVSPPPPLTPETVLEKEIMGKATVEFLVDTVSTLNIDSLFKPGVSHAQIIKAKVKDAKAGQEFLVIVHREVATAMLKSGIVDPAAYFRGKELRVSGMIERLQPTSDPTRTIYKIHVSKQAQLESIRTP